MCRRTATFHLVLLFAELTWGKALGGPEGGVWGEGLGDLSGAPVDSGEAGLVVVGADGTPIQDKLLSMLKAPFLSDSLTTNAIEDSLLAAAKTALAHHVIPRFKIPRGTLTYLTNPHWEILYFLKHGHFPLMTKKRLGDWRDTTAFLSDRARQIRDILNHKSNFLSEDGLRLLGNLDEIHPDVLFTFDGPLGAFFATREEAEELVREYERRHGEIVEGAAGPPSSDNEESNFLDGLTLALKAAPPDPRPLRKRDGILKYFLDRAHKPPPSEDAQAAWMKTFLVDHDPSWVRGRMKAAKPHVVQRSDAADSRALYSSGGGAISARSGGGGASEGTGGGGGATGGDDSSSQGGPRRKFQTQGW